MGVFGFVQKKIEEKILGNIHEELMLSYGLYQMFYRRVPCHSSTGNSHLVLGIRPREELRVLFHFCDSTGYACVQSNSDEYSWHEVPWMTANSKQSAVAMYDFMLEVEKRLG